MWKRKFDFADRDKYSGTLIFLFYFSYPSLNSKYKLFSYIYISSWLFKSLYRLNLNDNSMYICFCHIYMICMYSRWIKGNHWWTFCKELNRYLVHFVTILKIEHFMEFFQTNTNLNKGAKTIQWEIVNNDIHSKANRHCSSLMH